MMSRVVARRRGERGAVLIETVIVIQLLFILAIGAVEVGLIVRDHQQAEGAARSAARTISSSGNSRLADFDGVATLQGALNQLEPGQLVSVTVFLAESDGSMPTACYTGSVAGRCNVYSGTSFFSLSQADFSGTDSCALGAVDRHWCPSDRVNELSAGPDWVGVRIELSHSSLAPFLGDRQVVSEAVMRLEPRFNP